MWNSKRRLAGFSLVELVIVIIIIGVIAAIAIPRMSKGARGAGESALVGNLSVLRNAIELYANEHDGTYPGAKTDGAGGAADSEAAFVSQLTKYTSAAGEVSDARDAAHPYGPYLRKGIPPAPVGTNKGKTTVTVAATGPTVAGTTGWVFNSATGDIIINSNASNDAADSTFDKY